MIGSQINMLCINSNKCLIYERCVVICFPDCIKKTLCCYVVAYYSSFGLYRLLWRILLRQSVLTVLCWIVHGPYRLWACRWGGLIHGRRRPDQYRPRLPDQHWPNCCFFCCHPHLEILYTAVVTSVSSSCSTVICVTMTAKEFEDKRALYIKKKLESKELCKPWSAMACVSLIRF